MNNVQDRLSFRYRSRAVGLPHLKGCECDECLGICGPGVGNECVTGCEFCSPPHPSEFRSQEEFASFYPEGV